MLPFVVLQAALVATASFAQRRQRCTGPSGATCPEDAPCCARDGWCDADCRQCTLGCHPFDSFEPTSCAPMPICEDWLVDFRDGLGTAYKGPWREFTNDADQYDWVLMGRGVLSDQFDLDTIVVEQDDGIRLRLEAPYSSSLEGNRLLSTRYMQYGTVDVVLKTAPWDDIATTMMLVSDNREVIRFDYVNHNGSRLVATQGLLTEDMDIVPTMPYNTDRFEVVHDSEEIDAPGDVSDEFHKYSIDWQADYIRWLFDNEEVRRLDRSDLNQTGGNRYPDMPARLEIVIINPLAYSDRPGWEEDGILWIDIQSVGVACGNATNNETVVPGEVTGWMYNANSTREEPRVEYTNEDVRTSGSLRRTVRTRFVCMVPVVAFVVALLL